MPKTPEEEAHLRAIAARLAATLEQKRAEYQAKREATKEKRRAYDAEKSQTPERKRVQARAAPSIPPNSPTISRVLTLSPHRVPVSVMKRRRHRTLLRLSDFASLS
jgi:hypothetical protein